MALLAKFLQASSMVNEPMGAPLISFQLYGSGQDQKGEYDECYPRSDENQPVLLRISFSEMEAEDDKQNASCQTCDLSDCNYVHLLI